MKRTKSQLDAQTFMFSESDSVISDQSLKMNSHIRSVFIIDLKPLSLIFI
jgi:hypothetical protein